jgi:phosphoacetylglucosamine mutase
VQPSPLLVDCANGVGALAISALAVHLPGENFLQPVNTSVDQRGVLNFQCGADFVKTSQSPPQSNSPTLAPGQRACSLDGDADRLMYYYLDAAGAFRMLDGDKIAALAAGFIVDQVHQAGLSDKLQVGVVQTAYANGSSTRYLEQVRV